MFIVCSSPPASHYAKGIEGYSLRKSLIPHRGRGGGCTRIHNRRVIRQHRHPKFFFGVEPQLFCPAYKGNSALYFLLVTSSVVPPIGARNQQLTSGNCGATHAVLQVASRANHSRKWCPPPEENVNEERQNCFRHCCCCGVVRPASGRPGGRSASGQ